MLKRLLAFSILAAVALLIWLPLWMMITGSFMGNKEITQCLAPIFGESRTPYAYWKLLPNFPTLRSYVELFVDSPVFFKMFWNSCSQVIPGIAGQLLIGVPAAWSFARFKYRGKNLIFIIYIALMIMPFQVTMVSSYLVLDKLHMMDSHLAIIIPTVFSTFPVFILEKFFRAIPKEFIEAAKIDGAGELKIFFYIGLPLGAAGIVSIIVLGFLEAWNQVEQPLVFLKDKSLWPLSLYLPEIPLERLGIALVASVTAMAPSLLLFLFGQKYLERGIVASGIVE